MGVIGFIILAGGLTANTLTTPITSIRFIHHSHLFSLAAANARSYVISQEEFYCLHGKREGNTLVIHAVVKPPQRSTKTRTLFFRDGNLMVRTTWMVFHNQCGPGTVADVHTHPDYDLNEPSDIDLRSWANNKRYDIHLIVFPCKKLCGGSVASSFYVNSNQIENIESPDGEFNIYR